MRISEGHPPTVNFINVLHAHFLFEILAPKITKPNVIREKLLNLLLHKKCARKMLMKLISTHGWPKFCQMMSKIKINKNSDKKSANNHYYTFKSM